MFDRFTDRAKKVMNLARQESQRFNHEYLGTEHILLGILQEGDGVAASVLEKKGLDLNKLRAEVEKVVKPGPKMVTATQLPFTPRARKVLELSMEEAGNLGHNYIGTEHLLLGLIKEHDGVAAQVLLNCGLTVKSVRADVLTFLADNPAPRHIADTGGGFRGHRLGIPVGPFTDRLKGLWSVAMEMAVAFNSHTVLPEHALFALLSDPKGVAADVLRATKTDETRLRSMLGESIARGAQKIDAALVVVDPLLRVAIALAQDEMRDTKQTSIGTGHLLVGILRQGGECARMLGHAGVELGTARDALRACLRKIDEDPIWDHVG